MILVSSIEVIGRWLSYGCRKLPMDQYTNCRTIVPKVCNLINHEKSEKVSVIMSSSLQHIAKQELILS